LIKKASAEDAVLLQTQLGEVDSLWDKVKKLSDYKSNKLLDALKDVRMQRNSFSVISIPQISTTYNFFFW